MSTRRRTQIYLEEAQIAALDARARALGVTRSDLIRDMVDRGLAANDTKPSLYDVVMRLGATAPDDAQERYGAQRAARKKRLAQRRTRRGS